MTVKVAHGKSLSLRWAQARNHAGYCVGIAALLVYFGCHGLQKAAAEGETRTISFHHMHTNEDLTVTYKVNGRYDEAALEKINQVLRDWREAEPIKMDPHLIDLLWEVHRETGSREPIWVVCGYRSPSTNSMLRKHSSGVAKFSQHMLGKAVDFYIPGVPLDQLRAAGLRAQRGGVGFYPTSGSPFVHLDTGNVRHWPRMPDEQLAAVLAKGQLASHSASDKGTQVAQADAPVRSKSVNLLARLFGGGKDEEEDAETAAAPPPAAKPTRTASVVAKPAAPRANDKAGPAVAAAPAKPAKPETFQVASAAGSFGLASTTSRPAIFAADDSVPAPKRPATAASLVSRAAATNAPTAADAPVSANDIINERGYWQGLPSAEPTSSAPAAAPTLASAASRPAPAAKRPAATASADPATTASVAPWPLAKNGDNEPAPNALSYAAQPTPIAAARTLPMGASHARGAAPGAGESTVAKRTDERAAAVAPAAPGPTPKIKSTNLVRVGDRFNDPWMRAMIVSPSAQSYMKTTVYGVQDFRTLGPYLQKPAITVAMTFTDDPLSGMTTERFVGSAVVFTPTVTFHPRTAALK